MDLNLQHYKCIKYFEKEGEKMRVEHIFMDRLTFVLIF